MRTLGGFFFLYVKQQNVFASLDLFAFFKLCVQQFNMYIEHVRDILDCFSTDTDKVKGKNPTQPQKKE